MLVKFFSVIEVWVKLGDINHTLGKFNIKIICYNKRVSMRYNETIWYPRAEEEYQERIKLEKVKMSLKM
jgi:hypothetical protein